MRSAPGRRRGEGLHEGAAGLPRLDDRIDHADVHRAPDSAGDLLVLCGQLRV